MKQTTTKFIHAPSTLSPLELFSDGGFHSKLGVGGWGVVLYAPNQATKTESGACRTHSSIEMELLAAVNALDIAQSTLQPNQPVILHTDSKILIEGFESKIARYRQQNWCHLSGRPVDSRDLWERFEHLVNSMQVTLKWVKGHSGVPGNQLADQLARDAMQEYLKNRHHH